jgi:hypothetical protein
VLRSVLVNETIKEKIDLKQESLINQQQLLLQPQQHPETS